MVRQFGLNQGDKAIIIEQGLDSVCFDRKKSALQTNLLMGVKK